MGAGHDDGDCVDTIAGLCALAATEGPGLRSEDDLAGGGAAGKLAVRLRGIGQREEVLHPQVQLTGFNPSKHRASPFFQLLAIAGVVPPTRAG